MIRKYLYKLLFTNLVDIYPNVEAALLCRNAPIVQSIKNLIASYRRQGKTEAADTLEDCAQRARIEVSKR